MTKTQQHSILVAAIKGSLTGALTEHESCEVARSMQGVQLEIFDADDLTSMYEAISLSISKNRATLGAAQRHVWQRIADQLAHIIERLNEPTGSPCRSIALKPTRKRY